MLGDCLKKKNTSVIGTSQPPTHPSNDATPVPPAEVLKPERNNFYENFAFKNTCAFEGSGFNQVSDNFDGQGISLGGLQWCVGQGSLQEKILKPYFSVNAPENDVEKILVEISQVSIKMGLDLCKKHLLTFNKLDHDIKNKLQLFAIKATPFQLKAAQGVFDYAWKMCKVHQMESLKAFWFFFDVGVQNGSMLDIPKPYPNYVEYHKIIDSEGGINRDTWFSCKVDEETLILCQWIALRAKNNKWRPDVMARKCTIAHGKGTVHDTIFNFPELNSVPSK